MAISKKAIFTRRKLVCACGGVLLSVLTGSATAATEQWTTLTRVVSPTPLTGASFGTAVAMSGQYLVVGEPYGTESGLSAAGRAYVYVRNGNTWTLWDTLVQVSPEADAHFGASAAISGDNILVGAPDYDFDAMNVDIGITYFYRRNVISGHFELLFGGVNVPSGAHSGYSVAVSASHAVIGAPDAAVGSKMQAGVATTWEYGAGIWTVAPTINADVAVASARFGTSVALYEPASSATASILAVGSPGNSAGNVGGSVFLFGHDAGGWSQSQRLLEQGEMAGDNFGTSVAITGNRVFGGSVNRSNPVGNDFAGSVTAFSGSLGSFTQEEELFSTNGSSSAVFGLGISLYTDGTVSRLLVGAPLADQSVSVINSGAVFAFNAGPPPVAWAQQDRLSLGANAADNDELGISVAAFGKYAAAGAPQRDVGTATKAGIVEIFIRDTIFTDGFE